MSNSETSSPEIIINPDLQGQGVDTESSESDAEIIAEKWFAQIPESDRVFEWTPKQVEGVLFILNSVQEKSNSHLFSTTDKLGNLPGSVQDALYDEDTTKNDVANAVKEFIADPIAGAADMDKVRKISEMELPLSVSRAIQSIILCEGKNSAVAVFADLIQLIEQAETKENIFEILRGPLRESLVSAQGQKNDAVRREATKLLIAKLYPEFCSSQEVRFFIKLGTPLPKTTEEKQKMLGNYQIKFQEIFNKPFVPSDAFEEDLKTFGSSAGTESFLVSDMAGQVKEWIKEEWCKKV